MFSNARPHISFVLLAVIGSIGLFGQLAILHNSLVHSYPFKMMNIPPAEFYASVGNWGYYISVVFGVIGVAVSARLARYLTAVLPVVIGPISYWLCFELAHLVQGFSQADMTGPNFGGYTGNTARYEFGYEALSLMLIGAIIASIAGFIITRFTTETEWLA